jgi:hypothetical protein
MRWSELGEDGYYHPKDDGQPDPDLGPLLFDLAECELFVRYTLLDICTRDSPEKWPTKPPLKGIYTNRSGGKLRGSDRALRVFVSVAAFRYCRAPFKLACNRVAEILEHQLGTSRRGRPPKPGATRDHLSKAETVRSLYNSYRDSLKEHELEMHIGFFRWWREWVVSATPLKLQRHVERVRRDFGTGVAERLESLTCDVQEWYGARENLSSYEAECLRRQRKVFSLRIDPPNCTI